jgi:hypothetical protein
MATLQRYRLRVDVARKLPDTRHVRGERPSTPARDDVSPIPLVSLALGSASAVVAWQRRAEFRASPWFHWFLYLNVAAVGLHQFEEYGWPGGFRDAFVGVFHDPAAAAIVPSATVLELGNAFGFTVLFAALGWAGTRVVWIGLAALFINSANALFHLAYSATQLTYVPGTVTGTLLYMPLAILAARYAVVHRAVDARRLVLAFAVGTLASFAPFIHVLALLRLH